MSRISPTRSGLMVVGDITPVPPPCGMATPAVTSPAALNRVSFVVRPSRVTLTEFRSRPLIVANCGPKRPGPDEVLTPHAGQNIQKVEHIVSHHREIADSLLAQNVADGRRALRDGVQRFRRHFDGCLRRAHLQLKVLPDRDGSEIRVVNVDV